MVKQRRKLNALFPEECQLQHYPELEESSLKRYVIVTFIIIIIIIIIIILMSR